MHEYVTVIDNALRALFPNQRLDLLLLVAALALARILAYLITVPVIGGATVSPQIKVGTGIAFVVILFPGIQHGLPPSNQLMTIGVVTMFALLIKEVLLGYTLGFVSSLVFQAAQVSGNLIDFQRGVLMSDIYAPNVEEHVSILGQFKLQLAIVFFLAIGAHRVFIAALFRSFETIPILKFPNLEANAHTSILLLLRLTGEVILVGVQLAAPAIVALLMVDMFLGITNRMTPQINVFALSMPLKPLVGVLMVLIALPLFLQRYVSYFAEFEKSFEQLLVSLVR